MSGQYYGAGQPPPPAGTVISPRLAMQPQVYPQGGVVYAQQPVVYTSPPVYAAGYPVVQPAPQQDHTSTTVLGVVLGITVGIIVLPVGIFFLCWCCLIIG